MDNWHWPQWTMAILMFFRLIIFASNHGKPVKEPYNFHMACLGAASTAFLLWKGGFWN